MIFVLNLFSHFYLFLSLRGAHSRFRTLRVSKGKWPHSRDAFLKEFCFEHLMDAKYDHLEPPCGSYNFIEILTLCEKVYDNEKYNHT